MSKGHAKKTREILKQGGTYSRGEIAEVLGLDYREVNAVFSDFIKSGEIERVSRGRYRYNINYRPEYRDSIILPRILRAVHISGIFSISEVAMLASAQVSHTRKTIRKLVNQGYVEKTGWRRNARGCVENVFKVKDRDRFFLKFVKLSTMDGK